MKKYELTDKIICPWCGAEMWWPREPWLKGNPYTGDSGYKMQGKCRGCDAMTPAAYGRTSEETMEKFFATLHRYEPPNKPMTLDEVKAHVKVIEAEPLWLEDNEEPIYGWTYSDLVAYWLDTDYGKTWRCWPRKPTKEERQTAGWEDEK